MILSIKILILLWIVNFAPPFLSFSLGNRFNTPLDMGICFPDGRPLFGCHKTIRGVAGGLLFGLAVGWLLGFSLFVSFFAALLSMTGDLVSSFIKRRLDLPSGFVVPGLDQIIEGGLPFIVLAPELNISPVHTLSLVFLFSLGAYAGSLFLNRVILEEPFSDYSRDMNLKPRFREWRSCQSIKNPFHPLINLEQTVFYYVFLKNVFRLLGLYKKGVKNALDVSEKNLEFCFDDLPDEFDGYRILFITDTHLDGLKGLTEKIISIIKDRKVDICLLGGDYRTSVYGDFGKSLLRLHHLIRSISSSDGTVAILGNHDCLEMIPVLEKRGVRFLVNDSIEIRRGGKSIWIAGVDDPFYYEAHDLDMTFKAVPPESFKILLSHSPCILKSAVSYSPQLYLCGHTHGGQIQLPFVGPVITHSRTPRMYSMGEWNYEGMKGYTSSGAGVSGIPVRFGCRGEVVFITLKKS